MTTPLRQSIPFGHETVSPDDKTACGHARQLIQLFMSEAKRNILPLVYIDTFLMVACNEGKQVKDYAEMTHVSKSVMSRQLLDIGPSTSPTREPGLGWVMSRANPNEPGKHEIFLTAKGLSLAARVRQLLDLWRSTQREE
jgi:hypothetical protein